MTKLLYKALTGTIIGVYYDVYRGTSRTYPEYIYEQAMLGDLQRRGIPCQRQPEYEVLYKDKMAGKQRLDLFVAGEVVVELKVARELTKLHKAQAISYLKVVGKQVSLLCNFGSAKPAFERLYFARPLLQDTQAVEPSLPADWPESYLSPELTYNVIGGLLDVHAILGPGFIHRIYANAVYHELQLRGLQVVPRREFQVFYHGRPIGGIKFNHLQVGDSLMVFPVAIQDINDLNIDNMKAWMRVQNVPLAIIANFYPDKLDFMVLRTGQENTDGQDGTD